MGNPSTTWTADPAANPSTTMVQPQNTAHIPGDPCDIDEDPLLLDATDPVTHPTYTQPTWTRSP